MTHLIVGSKNPVKVNAASHALQLCLGCDALTVESLSVTSGVPEQPMSEAQTRLGAVNRVEACQRSLSTTLVSDAWVIAIEGGVDNFTDGAATFAYVAIAHGNKRSVGRSSNLPLPPKVYHRLLQGEELGPVMDDEFNTVNIKQKGGAIGLLTNHLLTRQSVYESAIIMAMAPFVYPQLY